MSASGSLQIVGCGFLPAMVLRENFLEVSIASVCATFLVATKNVIHSISHFGIGKTVDWHL